MPAKLTVGKALLLRAVIRRGKPQMLKTVTQNFVRKADILKCEGRFVVAKSPIRIAAARIDLERCAMSPFHGQITRDSTGNVDLVAEMNKHPDALWIRVKAIEADAPNDNGDFFSREEIIKSYRSFEGVPVFTNHENNKVENAKGKVVKAEWEEREGAVYCTMYIDRKANPSLCRAIEEGYVTDVSMGTQVDFSTCSVCEKKAYTADDYCEHVRTMKGRKIEGNHVFEKNYGLKFIEISVVTDGACKDCTIREVIDPGEYLTRVADAVSTVTRAIKVGQMMKDSGQAEIQQLNQAMDLLEGVCRAMLDQRSYIDLEYLNKLSEVLADLQHVNDELVDQGYGRIGDPSQMQQQQMGIPPLPENSGGGTQEQATQGPKPFLSGTSPGGVGNVTEPATASARGTVILSKIKDLQNRIQKIYEEKHAKLSTGGDTVDKTEKANQTVAKLATIWKNPSVKNYEGEFAEGEFRVIFTKDEIHGVRGGKKIASIKKAELESDVKAELMGNPRVCAGHILDALKAEYAHLEKSAAYDAGVSEKDQHEMTMESQLRTQKPELHPRTNEVRESITEDQLRDKREGYDFHKRTEEVRDSITEKQLADGKYQGYDYFKRQNDPRDETFELQLRNEKWKGNKTPAGHDGEWAAGAKMSDQHQETMEKQLDGWKDKDSRHLPTDRITEKQLAEDSENWGRRIASKEDARKAVTAGYKAIARTAAATGATPDEIIEIVKDMTHSAQNRTAAEKAIEALAGRKDVRTAMLRRAKFHGAPKTASMGEVADFMLGSMKDCGLCGNVGYEVLEMIGSQKDSYNRIAEAITAGASDDDWRFTATGGSSKDLLREVLSETGAEEVKVILAKGSVKADEKDAGKFAEAAFQAAVKQAEAQGLKITDKVHVAKKQDGSVEVSMLGVKADQAPKETVAAVAAPEPVKAEVDLAQRKEARRQTVAQMGGAMPDMGMGGAPGAGAGPGGGTTMPAAPGGAADPTAGMPPVAGLGDAGGMGEEEEAGVGEAIPPGGICPVCGSDNVDIRHGEFDCNDCGAAGDFEIQINITNWPGTLEDSEPTSEEGMDMGGEDEGGLGDMGGGAGMEMPPVGMQQAFRVTPDMVKKASNKPIGSYCPHCGSSDVKLEAKAGCGKGSCNKCKGCYSTELKIDTKTKELWASLAWFDRQMIKEANLQRAERKQALAEAKKAKQRQASLDEALRKTGLVAKFAAADVKGKAGIIARLVDKNLLPKE